MESYEVKLNSAFYRRNIRIWKEDFSCVVSSLEARTSFYEGQPLRKRMCIFMVPGFPLSFATRVCGTGSMLTRMYLTAQGPLTPTPGSAPTEV